eukprot:CAMPEP_0201682116 /NCGR_PEP_ID=MMETSP0494-20130426/51456_1 /ASSEMBLY_ACC=CAM_ASM_000839 /TAXON_ID=420259 /ORGANISM="Thalassiosira gravida, Strain GMp14c1" /LENGTH=1055 /DNA_ID=CAMNT_0048165873 /DNA_START=148 /DNA_END=3316 /DNA_ORIENTATION=-
MTRCANIICCSGGQHGRSSKRSYKKKTRNAALRDQFNDTNLDIFLLGICFALYNSYGAEVFAFPAPQLFDDAGVDNTPSLPLVENLDIDEVEDPVYAVLFPWFTQTLAIFIYYIISRYLKILPYTAIVFILGTSIGYFSNNQQENAIAYSTSIWLGINGQVILLVFLPGLIFHDSITINVHLFFQAFWQLIVFAFPMVLGGTSLTALVAIYILPYNWSPSLCMTFGAILSGTDPIAVAGLLNASGAPNRLKMHISGESLLNDGSVVVLFNIFSSLFFHELGIPGFGEQFSLGEGFTYFFRLSLGGIAIGSAFGLGTVLMLKLLNRRLSEEENVVQVVLLVSSAYLAYFTSEILCLCSGIMATIACGITVKVLGETFINDHSLTLHFWQVTAELLNTLLFVLGGCLWGDILSKDTFSTNLSDWGYLALLFVILIVIRFVLVFGLYPLTAKIGIGTNIKESVFMSYGGFRGSVGIALALSLNAQIYNHTKEDDGYRNETDKVFCLVGGISVLTLLINGMTSVPLLSALGLAATENTRRKVIENYRQQMVQNTLQAYVDFFLKKDGVGLTILLSKSTFHLQNTLQAYVRLLSQERWRRIDHSIVKEHIPFLSEFSFDELMVAVERHKNNTPVHLYAKPRLEHVFPYLKEDQIGDDSTLSNVKKSRSLELLFKSKSYEKIVQLERSCPSPRENQSKDSTWKGIFDTQLGQEGSSTDNYENIDEVRLNYIEILRSSYHHQIENGSLEEHGDLTYSLFQGLDFCEDACIKGQPLNDWESTKVASDTRVVLANRIFLMVLRRLNQLWQRERKWCTGLDLIDPKMFKIRFIVRQNLAFVRAHRHSRRVFEDQFASNPLTPAEVKVIEESQAQVRLAEADLNGIDQLVVTAVKGHLLCLILLNSSVRFVERLSRQRLIPEKAASEILEALDGYVEHVWVCEKLAHDHDGRLSTSIQLARLKQLPQNIQDEFNIWEAIEEITKTILSPVKGLPARHAIFRQRSGGNQDFTIGMSTAVTMKITDGSDGCDVRSQCCDPQSGDVPTSKTDESDTIPLFFEEDGPFTF